jgi:thiamine biosynthesis lipoprotein
MREPFQPKRLIVPAIIVVLAFGALLWRRPVADSGDRIQRYGGQTMGTTWSVLVAGPADASLGLGIQGVLDEVDGRMSTWKPDSELSRLNSSPDISPLSPETLEVLSLSRQVWEQSGGAFDVTVGPLVNAWGFGPSGRGVPSDEELDELRLHVGQELLVLGASSATKADPLLYVDLSAIAKGYAVDRVSETLSERGFPDHMVEVGGEIRVAGLKDVDTPWMLAIEAPVAGQRGQVQRQLPSTDLSLATSGDYRNFRLVEGGERVSHTIDPRTGRPIEHDLASVSVIHERCALADAYATAINVLGPEEGLRLAQDLQLEALLIVRHEDGSFTEDGTGRFAR